MNRNTITEEQLDRALRDLNSDIHADDEVLARVRQRLATLPSPQPQRVATPAASSWAPRRRRRWPLVAAAAVVALAAVLLPTLLGPHALPPASAKASATMNQAAAAAAIQRDTPAPAGQFRRITVHAWWATESGDTMFLTENVIQTWVPAPTSDSSIPWVIKRGPTGAMKWVVGTPAETADNGLDPRSIYPSWTRQSECGDFLNGGGCERSGSWQDPSPAFIAGLPNDPKALRALLTEAVGDKSPAIFEAAADALKTGLLPANVRANLYAAISRLPGLTLTEDQANLDGQAGTSLGVDDGTVRHDIIIDPQSGAFIGERQIATAQFGPAPAGTLLASTSVTDSVVAASDVPRP